MIRKSGSLRKDHAQTRTGVIRLRLSQSSDQSRRPVVMPAGRFPEAARERDVSSRPREPHSPRHRKHPCGGVLRERDDSENNVTEVGTIVKMVAALMTRRMKTDMFCN
jgi:hypothetical protein